MTKITTKDHPVQLTINKCNNIDSGAVEIEPNTLNVKYAMNGTGKSTIARAIALHLKGEGLGELIQFKLLASKESGDQPSITGLDSIKTIHIFNDTFVDQFAFMKDEVLENSFEIFVRTPDYDQQIAKIETLISGIKETFKNDQGIDKVIGDLSVLSDSFGKSKSGYSEAGALAKGIGKGNKIANIPKELESYADYLKSSSNSKWIRWQIEGNTYSSMSINCPYCTTPTTDKKETILGVSKAYDSKSIEHLNGIISVLDRLGSYFSADAKGKVDRLTKNVSGLAKEEITYLLQIKQQADTLRGKLLDLKGISFYSLKDAEQVADHFRKMKIDLEYLPELNSTDTGSIVKKINESLDSLLKQVGLLQGEVAKQRDIIERTVNENSSGINRFLKNAGYKYQVAVEYAESTYKMKLRHSECAQAVASGIQHLSYGERNAFALVLFMYSCLSKNPDIIILDDPISSFDKNKKYAVIDMLFRTSRCLRGKTVLLMTHDFEPLIDIFHTFHGDFQPMPRAAFISCSRGVIRETPILKSDITSFAQICETAVKSAADDVVKLVYLRRHYEIQGNKELPYEFISNLLHKRPKPVTIKSGIETALTDADVALAVGIIRKAIPKFDYASML